MSSVFSQETSFPYKVIIGDDGSNDGTIEKIKVWQRKHPEQIQLVVQERDDEINYIKGVRASRNRLSLIKLVDTDYFIFLDGDDYYTDIHKLQK